MKFNILHLDLVRVVQTLYRHSLPAGIGIGQHLKDAVDELTKEESENLLMDGAKTIGRDLKLITIDYVHGRPLKFEYVVKTGVTYATSYDVRNGKYKFLEALTNEFGGNEVKITRKTYEPGLTFANIDEQKREIHAWSKVIKQNTWNKILPKN